MRSVAYHEELSNDDLILKDAKAPFPGTPLPWLKTYHRPAWYSILMLTSVLALPLILMLRYSILILTLILILILGFRV